MKDRDYYSALTFHIMSEGESQSVADHLSRQRERYFNYQVETIGADHVTEAYITTLVYDMLDQMVGILDTVPNPGNAYDILKREAAVLFRFSGISLPAGVAQYVANLYDRLTCIPA